MTPEKLKKLGIVAIDVANRKFFIPIAGEIIIPNNVGINWIYSRIYEAGISDGIYKGKIEKINEIKKCLNIDIEDI